MSKVLVALHVVEASRSERAGLRDQYDICPLLSTKGRIRASPDLEPARAAMATRPSWPEIAHGAGLASLFPRGVPSVRRTP